MKPQFSILCIKKCLSRIEFLLLSPYGTFTKIIYRTRCRLRKKNILFQIKKTKVGNTLRCCNIENRNAYRVSCVEKASQVFEQGVSLREDRARLKAAPRYHQSYVWRVIGSRCNLRRVASFVAAILGGWTTFFCKPLDRLYDAILFVF